MHFNMTKISSLLFTNYLEFFWIWQIFFFFAFFLELNKHNCSLSEFPDNSCFPVLLFWKYLPELRHKPFFQLDESGCFVSPALSRLADTAEVLGSTKSLKVLFLSLRIFIKFFIFLSFIGKAFKLFPDYYGSKPSTSDSKRSSTGSERGQVFSK